MRKKAPVEYSEVETQRRFMQSLKGAVSTPPKPLKTMKKGKRKKKPDR